jgi:hypothetical protein
VVGVGHPVEAAYKLPGPLPAGSYHLVADGITYMTPTVEFDVLWRAPGAADQTIVSFTHQYPTGNASSYEDQATAARFEAKGGDQLVLRLTLLGTDPTPDYVPIAEHPSTPTARMLSLDIP